VWEKKRVYHLEKNFLFMKIEGNMFFFMTRNKKHGKHEIFYGKRPRGEQEDSEPRNARGPKTNERGTTSSPKRKTTNNKSSRKERDEDTIKRGAHPHEPNTNRKGRGVD
jgi:hypothetical protein